MYSSSVSFMFFDAIISPIYHLVLGFFLSFLSFFFFFVTICYIFGEQLKIYLWPRKFLLVTKNWYFQLKVIVSLELWSTISFLVTGFELKALPFKNGITNNWSYLIYELKKCLNEYLIRINCYLSYKVPSYLWNKCIKLS